MSTHYYLACDNCRKALWIAQDGLSGFTFFSAEPECLSAMARFLAAHTVCGGDHLEVVSEGVVDVQDYDEIPWTPKHISEPPR